MQTVLDFRRVGQFLSASWITGGLFTQMAPTPTVPSLFNATLFELAGGLEQGLFTSVDLVTAYKARIEEVDSTFHSIIEINPDVLDIASSLDKELQNNGRRSIWHGIPIVLKDNIVTFDKMNASAGSWAVFGAKPPRESAIIAKLRKAGALILGKSNLSEWANYRSAQSNSGWSPRGGQCEGIFYPRMSPSGSSSGSGVSTGLGLTFAAIGTETDGSIICPSEASNIVGIKPTVGLVSRDGVIPASNLQDSIGPMAKTVQDAAALLTVIAGKDRHDPRTNSIPFDQVPDYSKACNSTDLRGKRIGVPRHLLDKVAPFVRTEFEAAVAAMKKQNADIIDVVLEGEEEHAEAKGDLALPIPSDFKATINHYFETLVVNPHNIRSLTELIEFTKSSPDEGYPERDVKFWEIADATDPADPVEGVGGLKAILKDHELDAVIVPGPLEPALHEAAVQGLPIIGVPFAFHPADTKLEWNARKNLYSSGPNKPVSMLFVGSAFSELSLIHIAYAFEQLTQAQSRGQPYKKPSIDLKDILGAKTRTQL